jgi:hypothetical protein
VRMARVVRAPRRLGLTMVIPRSWSVGLMDECSYIVRDMSMECWQTDG